MTVQAPTAAEDIEATLGFRVWVLGFRVWETEGFLNKKLSQRVPAFLSIML